MLPSNAPEQCPVAMLPSNGTYVRTDATNEEGCHLSGDNSPYVTRTRTYGIRR